MVKHIVMWNIQDGLDKPSVMAELKEKLEGLKQHIDVLVKIELGFNFNETPMARDVALYTEFQTVEDLNTYITHPKHVEVGGFVRAVTTDRVVVDYQD